MRIRSLPNTAARGTGLALETLEHRTLLSADSLTTGWQPSVELNDSTVFETVQDNPAVSTGDANGDGSFDQMDLIGVLQAGKYLTGETANWSEGDWNGDSVFDQKDVVAALQAGNFLGSAFTAKNAPTSGATQISGEGVVLGFGATCGGNNLSAPDGLTLELTKGNLVGCWFTTEVTQFKGNPSGTFDESGGTVQERGKETFIGSYYDDNGVLLGTGEFSTTYKFSGKFDANFDEIHGRCQHPLVNSTGIGVFEDYTGRVDFKDIDPPSGDLAYRGHFRLPNGG